MHVLFHCNGGGSLGVGHVLRSLALAEEARAAGHRCTFAGEFAGDFVVRQLHNLGTETVNVPRSDESASDLARLVAQLSPDVLHADTYDDLELALTGHAPLLSNVEDAEFGRRPADLVIDPNLGAETEPREVEGHAAEPLLLRGARFAPLRAVVTERRGEWQLREQATRVLVVMGGTDPMGLTPKVLTALAETGLALHVTAITSRERRPACEAALAAHPGQLSVELLDPSDDLPALMAHHDLVVSAAGTSVWELCCIGVPMALVCAVDNQRAGYDRVVQAGAALGLGSTLEGAEAGDAARQLREALENPATRQDLARQAAQVVDGLGAWRIVRTWEQLTTGAPSKPVETALQVRPAALADAHALLAWRNDPATRRNSRQQHAVQPDEHRTWLEASLSREDRVLLIAADGSGDVGTVRWDRVGDAEWEVSITVAPERRGQGLARLLLAAGEQELARTERVRATYAEVHASNQASVRLFAAAGYLPDAPADELGFLTFRKPLLAPQR